MATKTFANMNLQLKLLVIITASLAVILLLLHLLELLSQFLLKKSGHAADQAQLGRPALVRKTIYPHKQCLITYTAADGRKRRIFARADSLIPAGTIVVIADVQASYFQVQPASRTKGEPGPAEPGGTGS